MCLDKRQNSVVSKLQSKRLSVLIHLLIEKALIGVRLPQIEGQAADRAIMVI